MSKLAQETFECLYRTRDGVLWAGTRDGLCRLLGDDLESLGTKQGLTQSTVLTICEDQERNLDQVDRGDRVDHAPAPAAELRVADGVEDAPRQLRSVENGHGLEPVRPQLAIQELLGTRHVRLLEMLDDDRNVGGAFRPGAGCRGRS